jgi:hypothetical protein
MMSSLRCRNLNLAPAAAACARDSDGTCRILTPGTAGY